MSILFDAAQFLERGWFGGVSTRDDYAVDEKEFGLFYFVKDIEVRSERVGAVLLFDIAEDFDVFTTEFLAEAKEFSSASLNQSCAADVRENKSFDTDEIKAGGASDFQGRFIGSFEHLETDRAVETLA